MKYLILLSLVLFGCSDWPTKDSQENEANPININITIDTDNLLNDPSDNDSQNVDVKSNSSSDNNSSNSDSNSNSTIDNSTGVTVFEFYSI